MSLLRKIELAELIAKAAHFGQVDKGGNPYIHHVMHVGNQFSTAEEVIVGYLHDVLEDSVLTSKVAIEIIFNHEVAEAVDALTRRAGELHSKYIERCKTNPLACKIKIEDIRHNMDRSRWPGMPDSYFERQQRALKVLLEAKR